MLQDSVDEFTFGSGLREEQDSFLQADGFSVLKNCYQDKVGSVVKLQGYSSFAKDVRNTFDDHLAAPATIGAQPKLIGRGNLVGAAANGYLFAKSDKWNLQGRVSPFVVEASTLADTDPDAALEIDSASSGQWAFTVYTYGGKARVVVRDLISGAAVNTMAIGSTTYSIVRVVRLDSSGNVGVLARSGTNLKFFVVTPSTVSGGVSNLLTDVDPFDCCYSSSGGVDYVYVAVGDRTNDEIRVYKFSWDGSALTQLASATQAQHYPTAVCVTADVSANRVAVGWVGWQGLTETARAKLWTQALGVATWGTLDLGSLGSAGAESVKTESIGVCAMGSLGHYFVWNDDASRSSSSVYGCAVSLAGSITSDDACHSMALASKPWWDGTRVLFAGCYYVALSADRIEDRHYYVLGIEGESLSMAPRRFVPFAHLTQLNAQQFDWSNRLGSVYLSNLAIQLTLPEKGGQAAKQNALRVYSLVNDARVAVSAELGACTYLAGGLLTQWDGLRVLEAGWLHAPEITNVSQVGIGSGSITGNYSVRATYVRRTATGELVRSRPCEAAPVVAASATGITVNFVVPQATLAGPEKSPFSVEIWRTVAGGATFYLDTAVNVDAGIQASQVVTLTHTDSALRTFEQLYTDGASGELANDPPLSAAHVCEWRNRLWLTDGERIGYSKESVAQRGAEFSLVQTIENAAGQRIAGLAGIEDSLTVFTRDRTAFIYGDAPAANGGGSTLVGPIPTNQELGCLHPAGIVKTSAGLLVPTRFGIQLYSPKRLYSRVGAAVEATMTTYPVVRDACLIKGTSLIWFACTNALGTLGTALLFDYEAGTWATGFEAAHASALSGSGPHVWTTFSGDCYERDGGYLLGSTEYAQQIETPWFRGGAGVIGELRARRFWALLRRLGTSGLKVEIAYDFGSYKHSLTLTDSQLAAMEGAPDAAKPRLPFPRQVCQSFRLRLTEVPPAGVSSRGFAFAGVRLLTAKRKTTGLMGSSANAPIQFVRDVSTNDEYVSVLRTKNLSLVVPGPMVTQPDDSAYSIAGHGSAGMTVLARMVVKRLDAGTSEFSYPEGGTGYCNILRKLESGAEEWSIRFSNTLAGGNRLTAVASNMAGTSRAIASSQLGSGVELWRVGDVYHIAAAFDFPMGLGVALYINGVKRRAPAASDSGIYSQIASYASNGFAPTQLTLSPVAVPANSPVDLFDVAILGTRLNDREIQDLAAIALK